MESFKHRHTNLLHPLARQSRDESMANGLFRLGKAATDMGHRNPTRQRGTEQWLRLRPSLTRRVTNFATLKMALAW